MKQQWQKHHMISWAANLSIIKFPDPSALHIMSRLQRLMIIYRIKANPAPNEYSLKQMAKFFLSLSFVKMTCMSPHVPISSNFNPVLHTHIPSHLSLSTWLKLTAISILKIHKNVLGVFLWIISIIWEFFDWHLSDTWFLGWGSEGIWWSVSERLCFVE